MKRSELRSDDPRFGVFVDALLEERPDAIDAAILDVLVMDNPLDEPIDNRTLMLQYATWAAYQFGRTNLTELRQVTARSFHAVYKTAVYADPTTTPLLREYGNMVSGSANERFQALSRYGKIAGLNTARIFEISDAFQPVVDPSHEFHGVAELSTLIGFAALEIGEREKAYLQEEPVRQAQVKALEQLWVA